MPDSATGYNLDDDPTRHYRPESNRAGVALCLSGGGFRAALFHLGAIRALNELDVLPQVKAIASVSGGSVLAAFLARADVWPLQRKLDHEEWEQKIARPFRRFVSRDRRTKPILLGLFPKHSAVDLFADEIRSALDEHSLRTLPMCPQFIFCASDLTFGGLWRFEREQVGDAEIGFAETKPPYDSLALAAAVSACIAPHFAPYVFPFREAEFRNGRIEPGDPLRKVGKVTLNDGGTYDNLGLEAVWRDYATVLVSDGGAPHLPMGDTWFSRMKGRTIGSSTLNDQMGRLARRRWFIANIQNSTFKGAYWGINTTPRNHSTRCNYGYSRDFVRTRIARIRTDLDAFSAGEQAVLENHGYMVAQASVSRWAGRVLGLTVLPELVGPLPHPDPHWTDEVQLGTDLARSHRLVLLGR